MSRFLALLTLTLASLASATPSEDEARAAVEKGLVAPLKANESRHSRFSRAYMPPQVRRVRVTDEKALTDARGAAFMSFAIDAHHGLVAPEDEEKSWRKDVIVGCVYPESGEVFVKRGDTYFPGELLLGKKAKADDRACRAAEAQVAAAPQRE